MSCPHGNHPKGCDICDEIDAAYKSGTELGKEESASAFLLLKECEVALCLLGEGESPLAEKIRKAIK